MATAHDSDEEQVVDGCRRGDREAQRVLFERHHRQVFRFLVAQCGDPAVAEDLTQETFLRAYRAIGSFRGGARVSSWMMRIALNCLYALARRDETGRRAQEASLVGEPRLAWTQPRTEPADRGEADAVHRALAMLTDSERSVVLLHDIQGYRYREIAEILGVAPGTVASRLSRARGRLRELLAMLDRHPHGTAEHSGQARHPTRVSVQGSGECGCESASDLEITAPVWSKP